MFRKHKFKAFKSRIRPPGDQIKIPARSHLMFTPAKTLKGSLPGSIKQDESSALQSSSGLRGLKRAS